MPKREKPFHLDMPFDEALQRYAQTDPREVAEKEKKAKKRRRSARTVAPSVARTLPGQSS